MKTAPLAPPAGIRLPLHTIATVVSLAARGRTLHNIMDATTLPATAVETIARHYGAPDVARLADQAEALRRQLDHTAVDDDDEPDQAAPRTHLGELLATATGLGSVKLVNRATWLMAKASELRTDLEVATAAAAAKAEAKAAAAAAAEQVKTAAAAAAAAKIEEDARKKRAAESEIAKLEKKVAALRKSVRSTSLNGESKIIREWAAAHDITCPSHGRIPTTVLKAFADANAS